MVRFFVEKKISTSMLFGSILLFGAISLNKLKITLLPQINIPKITILTMYQNASAKEMENLVTRHVESTVASVNGVKEIESKSQEGISIVTVTLSWGSDTDLAIISLRQKLDLIRNLFPQDTERPVIIKYDPSEEPVINLLIQPRDIEFEKMREFLEKNVKPEMERITGIANVIIDGGEKREIQVLVDPKELYNSDLSYSELYDRISSSNYNFPAGNLSENEFEYTIRLDGQYKEMSEIENTVISMTKEGVPVFLNSIAKVIDTYKEKKGTTIYNGKEAIILSLYKEPDKNTIIVAQKFYEKLEDLKIKYRKYIDFRIINDESQYISKSIDNISANALLGGLIAFAILLVFLNSYKTAFIVVLTIPISIFMTFIMMYINDISLNVMSLGGLALGVGMLVDNSIVVLESIDNHKKEQHLYGSLNNAVISGVERVKSSTVASTLTSIIVFLPIIFVTGIAGEIFKELALIISFSLFSSLFTSLSLIPMLASISSKENEKAFKYAYITEKIHHFSNGFLEGIKNLYSKILPILLNRTRFVLLFGILFITAGFIIFQSLPQELFPDTDRKIAGIVIKNKPNISLKKNIEFVSELNEWINKEAHIDKAYFKIGHDEENMHDLVNGKKEINYIMGTFYLQDQEKSSKEFLDYLGNHLSKFSEIIFSSHLKGDIIQKILGIKNNTIYIQVSSKDEQLNELWTRNFFQYIKKLNGVKNIESSVSRKRIEYKANIDRKKMSTFALASYEVGSIMKASIDGEIVTYYKDGDWEIPVRIKMDPNAINQVKSIENLYIPSPNEVQIKLDQIAQIEEKNQKNVIHRKNSRKMDIIEIQYEKGYKDALLETLQKKKNEFIKEIRNDKKVSDIANIEIDVFSSDHKIQKSLSQLISTFILSSILIYMLLASQFESLLHPFSVALSIPMMIPGVAFALFITGNSISITSSMGIIMLVGIVVNNAIVLYEYIRYFREQKQLTSVNRENLIEIIIEAGKERIRPIIMTTVTTVLGVLPMAIVSPESGNMQAPLAIVVFFGLLFSTVLTLIYFPSVYLFFEMAKINIRNFFEKRKR